MVLLYKVYKITHSRSQTHPLSHSQTPHTLYHAHMHTPHKLFLSLRLPPSLSHTHTQTHQINKRCKQQDRAILVTDTSIFKLDPRKHFQRKKSPLNLSMIDGVSVSSSHDQAFIIHFQGGKDLLCYMINSQNENRVAELVAVLCQICQRFVCV